MRQIEKKQIEGQRYGEERALYGAHAIALKNCAFDGAEDGESALKEARDVLVEDTFCNLRYPFWHDQRLTLRRCEMTPLCRAALWYSEDVEIEDCMLHGIKALRECDRVAMRGCDVISPEFGWFTRDLCMKDTSVEGEYFLLRVSDFHLDGVTLTGKYSFQYAEDGVIENCILNTKDALWHAKNVTVRNSVVKGEYLAWYSENLTLIDCKISGTQPLCYCKGLKLINCELTDADLCFERSEVEATLTTPVISIKNPRAGYISAPSVGQVIMDDPQALGEIQLTGI